MTRVVRRLMITAHVVFSVGWLGAVIAFLALSIAGLKSHDTDVIRAVYPSMNLISRFVIIPMCLASVSTGLLQALTTPWGLFRHYWIVLKFGLGIFATIALLVHQFGVIAVAASNISGASARALLTTGIPAPLKTELVLAPSLSIVLLVVATTLGIYKPWGLTPYGLRTRQERQSAPPLNSDRTPLGVRIFLTVLGLLALVFVVLHLTGHGFEMHGH